MRAGLIVETLTHLALALTTSAWVAVPVFLVFGAHAFIWGTTSVTIRQRVVPTNLQGRVGSVNMVGTYGGLVIGSGIGGVLAQHLRRRRAVLVRVRRLRGVRDCHLASAPPYRPRGPAAEIGDALPMSGQSTAVRSQERRQCGQHLLGRLFGDPVAGAGDDDALHVVGERLHRLPDVCAELASPPIASTGIVSGWLLRCWFCAMVASSAR